MWASTMPAAALADGAQGAPHVALPAHLTPTEQAELALESSVQGPDHARQHLAMRMARARTAEAADPAFDACRPRGRALAADFTRPLPPEDQPTGQARCSTLPAQPTGRRLAQLGRWATDVLDLPHYAIHAVALPSGKILFWGFEWTQRIITKNADSHQGTSSAATIWDPAKGTGPAAFKPVPSPLVDVDGDGVPERVPLYCSGQSYLPDGRILVTGGTLDLRWAARGYTKPPGVKIVLIFDPVTETWARSQDMAVARWYPSQVELADGRTLVMAGFNDEKPTTLDSVVEVVSHDGTRVTHVPSADRETWTYPGLLLLPDATVLLAGPRPQDTGILDPLTMTWSAIPPLPQGRGGENLVPVPSRDGTASRAMMIGGADFSKQGGEAVVPAYHTTLRFDSRNPRAGWRHAPSQHQPRNWPNTVLLPDGSMVTVGGGTEINSNDGPSASSALNRRVELWDPVTGGWRLGPAQREDRTYHSVAVLLEDGRVWSAGDDANPNRDGDTAEFYEPPYLFRGSRPKIVAAPRRIAPRKRFALTVAGSAPSRITMLAPAATTHGRDMNQRFVELEIVSAATQGHRTRVVVRGPRSLAAAPPGPWMLFALSKRGAPSVAHWSRVR
jgi:galactose oxidase-like protein